MSFRLENVLPIPRWNREMRGDTSLEDSLNIIHNIAKSGNDVQSELDKVMKLRY